MESLLHKVEKKTILSTQLGTEQNHFVNITMDVYLQKPNGNLQLREEMIVVIIHTQVVTTQMMWHGIMTTLPDQHILLE